MSALDIRHDEYLMALGVWLMQHNFPVPTDLAMDLHEAQIPTAALERVNRTFTAYQLVDLMAVDDLSEEIHNYNFDEETIQALTRIHLVIRGELQQ